MRRHFRGISKRAALLASVSLCVPAIAYAQDGTASGAETVVVTGSRISRPDFQSPTPVTAVNSSELNSAAKTTIADILNQLPQFGSPTTSTAGFQGGQNGGANYVNLRNLGSTRTLVLLNGERVAASSLTNAVDLNTLPTTLLQRVDVVTGGASASYGSDAVAGVVNLILDTNFQGIKASVQYSNNGQNAYEGYKADVAGGTSFDGDRGHVVASFSYFDNPQYYTVGQAPWNNYTALVLNPAYTATNGLPQLIHANGTGVSVATQGGVIMSGPLKYTQFVGPNGTPTAFHPGNISGNISSGGDGDRSWLANSPIAITQHGYNFFTYGSYRVAPQITAHLSLDYGTDGGSSEVGPYQRFGPSIPISIDNPYIPAQTRAQMVALGITSFMMGSTNSNLGSPKIHGVEYPSTRIQQRAELGFDGTFGDNWSWNAYYEHGETHAVTRWLHDNYIPYYNLAVDAVSAPVGNAAGIAPGTAVCRSTLTNPINGCVPLNVFGNGPGVASDAAIKYISPVAFTQINNKQDVAAVSAQGEPFSDWAGPISLAGGAEYRSESALSFSDALSYTRQFNYGNNQPFSGAVNVYEAYLETVVPLVRDEWYAKSIDFNGAGRITDYSTSGVVETWKLGLTDQISDEYRLRATWSSDIRAPNLSELFTKATSGGQSFPDPFRPGTSPTVLATTKGNPNLKPEQASTISGGIVITPDWLPGLSASFDWYSINIKGAIASIAPVDELGYCFAGQTAFCGLVIRNAAGVITEIDSIPTNTAAQTTSGLDVEAEYAHDLWNGSVNLRALANYTDESTITQNGRVIDNAGSLSASTVGGAGQPKFKATLAATYSEAEFSGTVQTRMIGSSHLINGYTSANVDDNSVPWVAYLDLRGSYNFTPHWQAFFAIDNVLDIPPPSVAISYTTAGVFFNPGSPGTVYDLLGRQYRVGLRVNF